MLRASFGTVAASSQGALPQNKQMATTAAGVRLHQCHITYLERIERNCHSGMFLNLKCKALTCTVPHVAQFTAASSQGALPQNKQMATTAAGVRLHQCHKTFLERIERNCHSGMFLNLQCKALTCTVPHVAQSQLAHRGHCLKTSKWQQLQLACDCTNVIKHI
jgi:hypothetical protein